MKRFNGNREAVYPLVLAVVGIILGWAAMKTRDLEGTFALVKWLLLAAFIAVTVTLIPLFIARFLWDRKAKTGTTLYFIQTKPERRLTEISNLTEIPNRTSDCRLLFPPGERETPPSGEFAAAYDASLGKILKNDGLPYYTDDPAVKAFRAGLFRELFERPDLHEILRRFAEEYPAEPSGSGMDSGDSLWQALTDCKARHGAVKALRNALNEANPRSAALRVLRDHLNEAAGSKAGQAEEEAFATLPKDLFSVKSLTLAVNLDGAGHAREAGIVALHGEPFDRDTAEPLVHPDGERYDLTLELNRELMGCVDRVLAEELQRLGANLDALRRAGLDDMLAGEIRFATEFAGLLRELADCGAKEVFDGTTGKNAVDPTTTMKQKQLAIQTPAIPCDESGEYYVLSIFGCSCAGKFILKYIQTQEKYSPV